jgi:phosphatidylinositol alpha-1,6-mannosyltransferase
VERHTNGHSALFVYANEDKRASKNETNAVVVNSKAEAIYKALSKKWGHDLIFVWHLRLLPLIPFLRLSRVRIIVMLLGIEAWTEHRRFTSKQLDKVDLFLTISNHTWRTFIEHNPQYASKPHQTVLLGIGDANRDEGSQPLGPPAALMLSRLSKAEDYKGHREVIRAWPRVLEKSPYAELWIAGDGDLRSDLQRLVKELRLEKQVHFQGEVSDETKQDLLGRSRCLVMPSRAEGFGLVYLEAMRLGRPCLVSTLDAGREVVNPPEAGLAANPDDQNALVESICRLLSDGPEWQQWSEQARIRYEENFTAKHFQKRLLTALFENQVSTGKQREEYAGAGPLPNPETL